LGRFALEANTSGYDNTAVGNEALEYNLTGFRNAAFGTNALTHNVDGFSNTATGHFALSGNTSGSYNTAHGFATLTANTTGGFNTAAGVWSLRYNMTGMENTATGSASLSGNLTGSRNTAMGSDALRSATASENNTAFGYSAGATHIGSNNTFIGYFAGSKAYIGYPVMKTGNNNVALGSFSGWEWSTGSNNIAIGNPGISADTNTIRIGTQGTQNKTFIAGIRGVTVTGAVPVLVNASGQLGIATSSRRFKEDIHQMGDASSALMKLKPVTFRYKEADAAGQKPLQFGLIAEEVDEVMPELVVRSVDGQIETVAYHVLPSLLLNEYQKQNRRLVDAEAMLAASEQELAALKAEIAVMKLAIGRLASATPQAGITLASTDGDETALLK